MSDDISIVLTLDDQEFTVGVKNAGKVLRQFERRSLATSQQVDKLDLSMDGLAGTTRDFTIILATAHAALKTIYSATLGWQKTIMDAAGEIERLEVMMRGMSSAATEVERNLEALNASKFITDFAQNAPFRMEALTDTFVKLKTVGIDPMNGSMRALTDSVAHFGGDSDILHRASVAIQQMMGKGVISMEELRQQLGEAVPSAMQIMARSMKMTVGELVGAIETGTVESSTAIRKMLSEMAMTFDGSGVRMMTTWQGVLQSMETRWKLFLKDIAGDTGDGTSYFNTIKGMVDELSQWMVSAEAKRFAAEMSEAMSTMANAIKTATIFLYQNREAIVAVGKVLLFYFATSRIAMGVAAITTAINRLNMSSGILGVAMSDFRGHMKAVGQQNEVFRGQLDATNGRMRTFASHSGNLVRSLPRLGMAFMSLAGPIGMAVSVITSAGLALLQLRTDIDSLASSIIRTQGLIATDNNLETLVKSRDKLIGEVAEQQAELEAVVQRGVAEGYSEESMRELYGGMLNEKLAELRTLETAIERAREGIHFRNVEGATADTNRIIQGLLDPIRSQYNQRRNELMDMRQEAQGDAAALARISEMEFEAIETAYVAKVAVINERERALNERREQIAGLTTKEAESEMAQIEASMAALESSRSDAERIKREAMEAQRLGNSFIEKPARGTPEHIKESQRALASMSRIVDAFGIKLAQARGKAEETNPHLEGLNERINQLREQLQPSDRTMFDSLVEQAVASAEELHAVEQKIKYEREGQQGFMQLLNRTASALGDTEQARLMKTRVQTMELREQVDRYEELIEKMREAGIDDSFIQQFSDSLVEYHDAAMNKITEDNASAWDQMMRQIRDFEADWGNVWKSSMDNAIDEIVRFTKEGKFNFTSLVDHILEQLLRIQLQKSLVQPLSGLMDIGVKAIGSYFNPTAYSGTFGDSLAAMPTTASANGNIMTGMGPAKLNKYANGGIARSPQVSLFGEGSRPEAYVPLPDGRTIPVTMSGGDAPNIQFNVINQSGQPVEAESAGGRFDGESYVLDVVLKAANRPGNFRDGLKGVMK